MRRIVDLVVLSLQGHVMSCSAANFDLVGIGVRLQPSASFSPSWAFWSIEPQSQKLMRQPFCRQLKWCE